MNIRAWYFVNECTRARLFEPSVASSAQMTSARRLWWRHHKTEFVFDHCGALSNVRDNNVYVGKYKEIQNR